ncbi:MAG TPA: maleylpyruvate isomerase N-terminal domain-containing protein [Actinomycetota bacterium]|nr:maleylpyruvate isomerase N-terminal domain-containing protein [Actinomycetota bacterium]
MVPREDLLRSEDRGWSELRSLLDSLSRQQALEPGLTAEGWSVKDLLWHLGAWWAKAGVMLERIRVGTYEGGDHGSNVDELNARFLEEGRRLDLSTVTAELYAARNHSLVEFAALPDVTPEAEEWFRESGAEHYDEHLGDLRVWVGKLTSAG